MNIPSIVDPRMLAQLPGFFPCLASIQDGSDTPNSIGEPVRSFTTVTGLEAVPCSVSNELNKIGDERRENQTVFAMRNFWIYLAGAFPQVTEKMQAVVTDQAGVQTTYDILSVITDQQRSITKLYAQVIE